ncbi:glycine zipper 2TM domain-containing protein [Caballeronia sp. LZ025]|jgi:outer membrane lipoprotein SlyB|uniref:glycine zipper 2TM domain-containing protein n=1 Tax=Caballeronia TaxID=1827195 RepID=UPI001FD10983|nr:MULTISPECIES: glycine zipper 2TM domain-containing protein [Caballeronia]MDR5732334.1 glycine zipper 2TM domain-containing protein [Caballeronia sp. LZ025]
MDNGTNKLASSPSPDASQPLPQQRRLHPLVATAAGAVIVASLAATAAITGVFPRASSTSAQNPQTQTAAVAQQHAVPPATPAAAPAQPVVQQPAPQPVQQAPVQPAPAQPSYAQQPPPKAAYCSTCGTVESISAVRREGHGTGIGAVGGAVAGGVVGNQFGRGGGRTAMTLLGALGGGLAGNSVEKHIRSETDYSVRVRMENGKTRYFTYKQQPPFAQGQHVRVRNGVLEAG